MSAKPGKAIQNEPGRRHRRHVRYRISFPVSVTALAGSQYIRHEAHCKDLSEAGIGLLLAAEFNASEVVTLQFCLPATQESWELRAVLRHRRGYHYGFEFLSPTTEQCTFFKTHLKGLERAD